MKRLPFVIHPRVIRMFSDQLVQSTDRAILELVKNAFDADAETCEVQILPAPGEIRVLDDGHGMSVKTIEKGWLVLGSPEKLTNERSREKRRYLAGSKGLGRMAISKLGTSATVMTGESRDSWLKFEFNPSEIATIAATGKTPTVLPEEIQRPPEALGDRGTVIQIHGVNEASVNDAFLGDLRRSLRLLKSPDFESVTEGDDFEIQLRLREGEPESMSPPAYEGFYHISADATVIDESTCELELIPSEVRYTGRRDAGPRAVLLEGDYSELDGVKFHIEWTLRGHAPGETEYWRRREAEEDALTGVFVYRDGIRVLPYGEEDNDWLRLQATYVRKGATERYPRPSQVLGWTSIGRETNTGFQETAGREGLDNNEAFKQLRELGIQIAGEIADLRRDLEPVRGAQVEQSESPEGRDKRVASARAAYQALTARLAEHDDFKGDLAKVEDVFVEYDDLSTKVTLYRERTSAGLLASLVLHDSGINLQQHLSLIQKARSAECGVQLHGAVLKVMADVLPRIVTGYDLLKGASRSGGHRLNEFDAGETLKQIVERFKVATSRQLDIKYVPHSLPIKMRESDLWSIAVNIIHNGVTSDEFLHAKRRDFPTRRELSVDARFKDDDLELVIEDNGPGLPDRPVEWMWRRSNSNRDGGGSGLGLWIVTDLLANYGGFIDAGPSKSFATGARFTVVIPGVKSS